jgi:hypothetical protein
MSCTFPLWRYHEGEPITVPCGRCTGCRLDRAKEWSLRIMHEASMHEENAFITLTYADENLPEDRSVSSKILQNFMKRLRKEIDPIKIRFYGVGEYGDKMGRPHYHAIIFGYGFPDKVVHRVQDPKARNRFSSLEDSYIVYKSPMLRRVWKEGFNTVGAVSTESAGYVARYIRKKIGGEMALDHYKGRNPEFALMSRRPGIGTNWIKKYMYDVYPKDFTTLKLKKFKAPRFYDNKLMRHSWKMYEGVKEERKEKIKRPDGLRRLQKEKYLKEITKNLKRSYEADE